MNRFISRRTAVRAFVLALLLLPLMSGKSVTPVSGDHADGHLHDWAPGSPVIEALQQGLINDGELITVCSSQFPQSTQAAVGRWNQALAFGVFSWTPVCSGAAVTVSTSGFSACSQTSHACTYPAAVDGDPDFSIINPTTLRFNPGLFPGTYPDGSTHLSRDITHELGHVLGHADYNGCAAGDTLMDTTEAGCFFETPQTLDVNNYAAAYFADAVSNLTGSSPSAGVVSLTWDPSSVHNENAFVIKRDGAIVGFTEQNIGSWSASNQPAGQHQYVVFSHTNAWCLGFGGYCGSVGVNVNIQAPPAPARPIDLHWKTTVTSVYRLEWTDNSTNETSFGVWKCGDWGATTTVSSTTSGSTGTKYTADMVIPADSKSCFTVLSTNAGGSSAFSPAAGFLNTTQGSCGSEVPCGHAHSTRRIQMLLSKPTESAATVNYIAYSLGSATLYKVDFWDNLFGVHLDGPYTVSGGANTGWRSHATTGTSTVVVFWCTSSACTDSHWDGLGY